MHPFFNQKVALPELKVSSMEKMKNLREIWPSEYSREDVNLCTLLRRMNVLYCDRLVNLFPTNPIPYQVHNLLIGGCYSLQVILDLDFGNCNHNYNKSIHGHEAEEEEEGYMRKISVLGCSSLRHVWRMKGVHSDQIVQQFKRLTRIDVADCRNFVHFFMSSTANINLGGLESIGIRTKYFGRNVSHMLDVSFEVEGSSTSTSRQNQKFEIVDARFRSGKLCRELDMVEHAQVVSFANLTTIRIDNCYKLVYAIPFYAVGQLRKLETLYISSCTMAELFQTDEIKSTSYVTEEEISESMTMIPRTDFHQLPKLTDMTIEYCGGLRYLFTSPTVRSLKQLKNLKIRFCGELQVIVKQEDASSEVVHFPCLQSMTLDNLESLNAFSLGLNEYEWPLLDELKIINCPSMTMFTCGHSSTPKLKYAFGKYSLDGDLNFNAASTPPQISRMCRISETTIEQQLQFPWSLSNLIEVDVEWNRDLLHIFSLDELSKLQRLEKIHVEECESLVGVFEVLDGTDNYLSRGHKWTVLEFTNLTKLSFKRCGLLKHIFTCSTIASFVNLQELNLSECEKMEVIVAHNEEEEEEEGRVEDRVIVFPHLKSMKLEYLRSLKGFCLQKYAFMWPSLGTLVIKGCPEIEVFTSGNSSAPELKLIDADFGLCYVKQNPNSFIHARNNRDSNFRNKVFVSGIGNGNGNGDGRGNVLHSVYNNKDKKKERVRFQCFLRIIILYLSFFRRYVSFDRNKL